MNAFVPLEIVVPVEALHTLVALERPVGDLLSRRLAVHSVHAVKVSSVPAVEASHDAIGGHASHQRHLAVGVVHVRQDGARHDVAVQVGM